MNEFTVTRLKVFVSVVALLVVALTYSRFGRELLISGDIKYVPADSIAVCALGEPKNVWAAIDHHFGTVIREKHRQGWLSQQLSSLQDQFKNLPVTSLSDLTKYGIDINKGIILSVLPNFQPLLILHITNDKAFRESLSKLNSTHLRTASCREKGSQSFSVTTVGEDSVFAEPVPGTIVAGSSCADLMESVANTERNSRYIQADDSFYDAVYAHLKGPLSTGANAFIFLRSNSLAQAASVVQQISIAIKFSSVDIEIEGGLRVSDSEAHVIADVLKTPEAVYPWRGSIPRDALSVGVIRDEAGSAYWSYLDSTRPGAVSDQLSDFLREIYKRGRVSQLLVSGLDYRSGILTVLMGLWGSPEEYDATIENVRERLRESRDRLILDRAREAYLSTHVNTLSPVAPQPVSISELQRCKLLDPPESSEFDDPYRTAPSTDGRRFQALDFQGADYVEKYRGHALEFIAPPITSNDLRYGFSKELVHQENVEQLLKGNRYRLVGTVVGGTLWVATDVHDLESLIDAQTDRRPQFSCDLNFQRAETLPEKLRLVFNIEAMTTSGYFSPNSDIKKLTENVLLDFREHPVGVVSLYEGTEANTLRFFADLPLSGTAKVQ